MYLKLSAKIEVKSTKIWTFEKVSSVEITLDSESLTDTCVIKLPKKIKWQNEAEIPLKRGDAVSVWLGYNGELELAFTGYIRTVGFKNPVVITCEDEMFRLKQIEAKKLYSLLQELERLLQIFDGVFLDLEAIEIYGRESTNSYNALVEHFKIQRLHYFSSSNFISIISDRLLKYVVILASELFDKWRILLDELGVVNQMYLYATSSAGFTNDVKCAFLVELSESLMEIIQSEDIKLQKYPNENGKLKPCLRTIINCYGKTLFRNEIEFDLEKILSCLVNTRVNIMHIKINQRKPALDGRESVLYAIKMSYLYRLVILEKLEINAILYEDNLIKRVGYIDGWNGIQEQLFNRLKQFL